MRLSFRLKTIIGIAIIEGSLLLFLVWSSIDYLQHSNEEELRTRAQTTAAILANLSRDSILSLDLAQLESFASQALDSPDAVYVRIKDADRILTQVGDKRFLDKPFKEDEQLDLITDGVFDVAADLEHSGIHYGRVELGLSIDRATLLFQTAIRHLSIIAAIEMLLVALFSYVLGSYLTRGLSYLRDASAGIANGKIGLQVRVRGNDELAQTGKAFNSMSKRMAETQTEMADNIRKSKVLALRLSEQEMRLTTILNTVLDGFVVIGSDGIIDDINPAGTALFGYSTNDLKGQSVKLLIPTPDQGKRDKSLSQLLKKGSKQLFGVGREVLGLRKDGTTFPMDLSVTEMELSGKRMYVGLVRDLTEKKKIEYEARRNAAMKSALVSANLDALITFDINDMIVEYNAVAENMFGYPSSQLVDQPVSHLILTSELKNTHLSGIADLLTSGGNSIIGQRIEVEAMRATGERFPAEVAIQLIEVDGEKMFTAFIRDICDRKEVEAALKAAKLEAESASEAKSRFLAHMSHEIRSPLNAVLGSVGLLLDDNTLKGEQQLYAKTAQTSAKALLSLINDVLDFSKIEAGQMQLDNTPFCLDKLLEDVADVVGFQARDKDVQTVIVKHQDTPQHYIGDKVRIRQILLNLMDNALKFTQHGAVVLNVNHADNMGSRLRFTVTDSGIGIAQDAVKALFDEFQQVDNSDATRHGGTGLGLSISRALCEAMKGTMKLESELGRGSQFSVDLPLKQTIINTPAEPDELASALSGVVVGLHPLVRSTIKSVFNSTANSRIHFASSQQEALSLISTHKGFLLAAGNLDIDDLIKLSETARVHQIAHRILLAPISDEKLGNLVNSDHYDFLLPVPLTLHRLQQIILDNSYNHYKTPAKTCLGSPRPGQSHGHILLAEDSAANRIVASGILERAGFSLDTAEDGQKALEALSVGVYDLVLMDVRMPVMDGIEATQRIRAQETIAASGTHLPIIAMTANTSDADRARCLNAGMDDFVPKPVDRKQLLKVLSRFIQTPGSRDLKSPSKNVILLEEDNHSHPILDVKIIEHLVEDTSPDALPKMLHLFIEEIQTRSTRLQDHAVLQAWDNMENEAHTLKSCAGTFGALELQSLAKLIETACRTKDQTSIEQQTAKLAEVMQATLSVYRENYSFLVSSNG